jgi:hypothetical protein
MLERIMMREQDLREGDHPQELVRYAEAGPVGDFIALISGMTAAILCFTNFFNGWVGYQTVYGVLMILVSVGIALFSATLLAARFAFRRVPALRSPSWAYFLGGACMIVLTMTALVFGWRGESALPVLFFMFMDGAAMFIGGMVSY